MVTTPPRAHSGDLTRSIILDYIRSSGRTSRVELATRSGLTESTISNVVRRLIADGLVVETGLSEPTGGKRRTLLDIERTSRYAVGVSLDRERLTFVVTDLSGRTVGGAMMRGTGDEDPVAVVARIAHQVDSLLDNVQIARASVVGIGLASPGPLDSANGVLRGRKPTAQWRDFPLREQLTETSGMLVIVDNDATCAALGEYWSSRTPAVSPISATVYMADGIGCGILVEGTVFHGASSNPGEIGHITLDVNGPTCGCGSRGCVELYASPAAVSARALLDPELVERLGLDLDSGAGRANFGRIATAATRGDIASHTLISDAARHLGMGIVTLTNILDLDEVYLSGPGFADAGAIFATVIQQQLDGGTFMGGIHSVRVSMSHVGTEAAALGAAALILRQEIAPHSMRAPN